MAEKNKGLGDILSTATIAVMFIVILLLVMFSASAYRSATEVQSENNSKRALLAYVTASIRDSSGKIRIISQDGCEGLALKTSGYERRIYMKDGELLEEYAAAAAALAPGEALVIGETDKFEISVVAPGLIQVETDCGVSYAHTGQDREIDGK